MPSWKAHCTSQKFIASDDWLAAQDVENKFRASVVPRYAIRTIFPLPVSALEEAHGGHFARNSNPYRVLVRLKIDEVGPISLPAGQTIHSFSRAISNHD